ncbi:MAG: GNAT family protein [Bacteroidales bacterium]|jgi:ribosomal-protein-serine acetyltransferase|nr:GNAT family protein [Bacteroidales bacterium]
MKLKADKDITLQKVRIKSAKEIFNCIDGSRDYLREWLSFVDQTKSWEDTKKYIRSIKEARGALKNLVFEVRYRDKIVGLIGLKDIDLMNNKAEIGYWLIKEAVGKGIMTRSCAALLNYAFDRLKLNKIWIRCAVENTRSCNIPKQMGFSFEGIERQGEMINGRYHDLKVYSLLRKEWKK